MIHGDYDVDGICSTTIMTRVLRQFGANAVPFIPRRIEDGYDLGPAGVDAALRNAVGLVVTCDCGTSAHEPVPSRLKRPPSRIGCQSGGSGNSRPIRSAAR